MDKEVELSTRAEIAFSEMQSESDRGCILVGTGVIEEILEELIAELYSYNEHVTKHAVVPLFDAMGPLSSFSAKIKIAYCLKIIPEWMFNDLEKIRKIRNRAAHEYSPKTFDNKEIIAITQTLKAADYAVESFREKEVSRDKQENKPTNKNIKKERVRFSISIGYIAGYLEGKKKEET